jgi:hypothetical protein
MKSFVVAGLQPIQSPDADSMVATINGPSSGDAVAIRYGPGLSYERIEGLFAGDTVIVRELRSGWYAATTRWGVTGWIYGGHLRGIASAPHGPAVIQEPLTCHCGESSLSLVVGQRVFIERDDGGDSNNIVLPSGLRLRVPARALQRIY